MEQVRIMLVDDHPLLRQGLSKVLGFEPAIKIVSEAGSGEEALDMLAESAPQVVLMDINLPGINGIETTRLIKARNSEIKVLVLTIHDTDEYLVDMIRAGASGYVLKDVAPETLIKAIFATLRGESYISPGIAGKVFGALTRLTKEIKLDSGKILTQREQEVLKLIANGYSNQKIAKHLTISEKTVKNHVTGILRKLEVDDRTQAAVFALKNKIV